MNLNFDNNDDNDNDNNQNEGNEEDNSNNEENQDMSENEDNAELLQEPDESVHSYDENEDFPQYANRVNKRLNEIIKNYKKEIKTKVKEVDEDKKMVRVLTEHTQSVEQQVKNKERFLEALNQNYDMEQHTYQVVERQIGKIRELRKNLDTQELELQERFNSLQQNIARANEKMDDYKLNMKNILEELEQWALAARQKEDDNLNIQKYKRHDELRIKEIILHIEKLTIEVNKKSRELEREVTETQAAQIEMEKTTQELRKLQNERQDLLDKLLKTEDMIKQIHESLKSECDKYYKNKQDLLKLKEDLDSKIESLNENTKLNKQAEEEVKRREVDLGKTRELQNSNENHLKEIMNDIEIKKNELGALARDLSNKTNKTNFYKNELEIKRKDLDEAKAEYKNKKDEIIKNENMFRTAKEREEEIFRQNIQYEKEARGAREKLEKTVNELYEKSKSLFDLREQEANMIGDINNIISARKNIKANIAKLESEITKQQELLYNVDFQIQLMERKVAWVQGKRTQEETNEINKEIEVLEKSKAELSQKLVKLENSLKMINEDLRTVETKLTTATDEKKRLTEFIEELELENMKCGQDLQKIMKKKEEVLVDHDLMKLEIKKLYDRLVAEANQVFKKENQLYQLELSIKEREKEIYVHKDILVSEHKLAEEERHKAAIELSMKLTRAKNLKLKYESLIQKNEKAEGEEKYSQAYYVIKTAQEKEELQRQKDEMEGKLKKCKKDLSSLYQTMNNLIERNEQLKGSLITKRTGNSDMLKKKELEEKVEKENKEMWERKNELDSLTASIQQGNLSLKEKSRQIEVLQSSSYTTRSKLDEQVKKLDKIKESCSLSDKKMAQVKREANIDLNNSEIGLEVQLNNEMLRNKFLKNAISILCSDIDEMKYSLSNELQEFQIASRPVSEHASSIQSNNSRMGR